MKVLEDSEEQGPIAAISSAAELDAEKEPVYPPAETI
jgi:hypothetical protein